MVRNDSPLQSVISMFLKSGPWAVMALAMVLGVGYELHCLFGIAGKSVSDYVIQSSRNNEVVMKAMERVEIEHASMLLSLKSLQDNTQRVSDAVLVNTSKLQEIEALIDEAKRIMSTVPAQRDEELRLLKEIEKGIRELCNNSSNQGS